MICESYSTPVSILSGEILRLRDRNRGELLLDLERQAEGLWETYLSLSVPLLPLPLLLLLWLRLGLFDILRVVGEGLSSVAFWSSTPSITSSKRLLRGPSSPASSRTSLLANRGRIMSQTLSSYSNWSTNSSMYVKVYPAGHKLIKTYDIRQ